MITHQEAEVLTSARQDAPLDPVVERELQAHLATCDQCRRFAASTERLTAGIRTLPGIAANPRMKREVMDRVRAGRGPFAGLLGGFGGGFQPGPAIAAIAMVAVIAMFGWLALDRLFFDEGGDGNNQIAAVPTTELTLEMAKSTETPQPTATVAPATETPTQVPAPTATTAPPPTETGAPTEPLEPTATTAPEPTATTAPEPTATTAPEPTATTAPAPTATTAPEPTATTAPEPTATTAPEPTAEPTSEDGPVDLTGPAEPTATTAPIVEPTPEPTATDVPPTATLEPTATEIPPTATVAPTMEPTATEIPPTPTVVVVPTATESPTPEPSPTPAIEPMDGATSEPAGAGDSGSVLGIGSADEDAEIPVTPEDSGDSGQDVTEITTEATETPTEDAGSSSNETSVIEPIEADGQDGQVAQDAGSDTTPESATESIEGAASGPASQQLIDVSERYSGIAGDPAGDLGLTDDGRLEYMTIPDAASMTTSEGFRLQSADAQPGVVQLCGDGFCEPGTETPDAAEWQGDVPLGVVDNTAYILRLYGDRSEVYALQTQGTQLIEGALIGELGPVSAPAAVYESGGSLFAWLPSGQWLQISGDSAQVLSGVYADPSNVRFAPSAEGGPLIGYFSQGSLVVAPVTAPDAAIITLPSDGVDFDISPPGDSVAMIRGNDVVIYDLQGNEVTVYEGGDTQPGSLIWLRSGIIWVDRATGAIYQIPETAP